MKLTKENVYVNLQGKSKEELTELWEFLDSIGEKQFRDSLNDFLNNYYGWTAYEFSCNSWLFSSSKVLIEKTEVTIEQLKEILQPMDLTLEQRLEKAEAEVKRLQSLIEEENKPKVGDWIFFNNGNTKGIDIIESIVEGKYSYCTQFCCYSESDVEKITNPELIKLLEQEIK